MYVKHLHARLVVVCDHAAQFAVSFVCVIPEFCCHTALFCLRVRVGGRRATFGLAVSVACSVGFGAFPTAAPTAWHDMIARSDLLRVETLLVLNSPRQADARRVPTLVVSLAIGVLRAVSRFRCDRFVPFGRGAPVLGKNQSHPSSPPLPPAPWAIPCCLTREMRSGLSVLFGPGLISMHSGGEGARTVAGVHVRAGNTARLPRERESSPPPFILVCNSDLVRTLEVVSWSS